MSDSQSDIPSQLRPDPDLCRFDLADRLDSIVTVHTLIPENGLTASALGTERSGHGVVIDDDGLVLTIGYVVTEAETLMLIDHDGKGTPAYLVGYDQETGFGLVKATRSQGWKAVPLGDSNDLSATQPMIAAGAGGVANSLEVSISEVREFAGYWEYLLDAAVITNPAHPTWGGTALLGMDGLLYGIGSLIIQSAEQEGLESAFNMFIPINALKPILNELIQYGRPDKPARPWMGWFVQETSKGLVVVGLVDGGPAELGGLEQGDIILAVSDRAVLDLPNLYRAVWSAGHAGVDIEVLYERGATQSATVLTSVDRNQMLLAGSVH